MNTTRVSITCCLLWLCGVVQLPMAIADQEVLFLKPDGSPAGDVKVYQTPVHHPGGMGEMGMEDMMMMDMEGGSGMGAAGMEMGGMSGMGGMGSMMMGMGGYDSASIAGRVLFKGEPVGDFKALPSHSGGKVTFSSPQIAEPQRGPHRYNGDVLAVSDSGLSFLPAGTPLKPTVKLRRGGQIRAATPSGIDPARYQLLICWQDGFAWPTDPMVTEFPNVKIAGNVDLSNWRFQPRFQVYQTSPFDRPIELPPGESRITIVPKPLPGEDAKPLKGRELFDLLTAGGPSQIVLVRGNEKQPIDVTFPPLQTIQIDLEQDRRDPLPDWGDQSSRVYRLGNPDTKLNVKPQTDPFGNVPSVSISSTSELTLYLNQLRQWRSSYFTGRTPSVVNEDSVQFDAIAPGTYYLNEETPSETVTLPVDSPSYQNGIVRFQIGTRQLGVELPLFRVEQPPEAEASTEHRQTTEHLSNSPNQPSAADDATTLKTVRQLLDEVETAMRRMSQHRQRLLRLQETLTKRSGNQSPNPRPAKSPPATADPFGGAPPSDSDDPFSPGPGADPFGQGSDNPFGPTTGDPFGASEDPFGGASGDPFGG
ncbi:hypothetical protein FYK55_06055 [Roseiconus nitratireducens]|uniref:Secreted protein n=2 Tax=Roseiconus nitratireducens TaxID=2605748 RepID=A0A5M6DFP7_9BACT|nr:hypothetical protein FYK55_06055 [Roseiconus nitratireducens]